MVNCLYCKSDQHVRRTGDDPFSDKRFTIKIMLCDRCKRTWKDYSYNEEGFNDESAIIPISESNTSSDSTG